ncbi:DUF2512 family protein [Alteribacillus sp. JSM 102045]|uniref:DUF2512 family protein n=1 Tax=Alteribacillus sp. JSM 102045 TaxID=1562101 RepID=UPI0035C0CE2F
MDHAKALAFKGIMTLVGLFLILTIGFGVSFWNVLLLTLIIGAISYPGDLFIMPKIRNMPAVFADFALAFLIIWLVGLAIFEPGTPAPLAALISAAVLAFGEYYFHTFLATHLLPANNKLRMDTQ